MDKSPAGAEARPSRRGSHNRVSRSGQRDGSRVGRLASHNKTSRQGLMRGHADNKENMSAADNDLFVGQRRRSTRDGFRREASGQNGHFGVSGVRMAPKHSAAERSWDGSMPRRQSSKAGVGRNASRKNRAEDSVVQMTEEVSRSLSRQSIVRGQEEAMRRTVKQDMLQVTTDEEDAFSNGTTDIKRAESQIAVSNDIALCESFSGEVLNSENPSGGNCMEATLADPKPAVRNDELQDNTQELKIAYSVTTSKPKGEPPVIEGKFEKPGSSDTSNVSCENSQNCDTSNECSSSLTGSEKMPLCGKWCDQCAGVGMMISAMMTELEQTRPLVEGSKRLSSSSSAKKGWRSVVSQTVLGENKSNKTSEKARLEQENSLLRATVDFLYKKMENMEQSIGNMQ